MQKLHPQQSANLFGSQRQPETGKISQRVRNISQDSDSLAKHDRKIKMDQLIDCFIVKDFTLPDALCTESCRCKDNEINCLLMFVYGSTFGC